MADKKQASCPPEDCSEDKIDVAQDFVSPIFKPFLPTNEYFSSTEYLLSPEFDSPSRVTSKTSKKTFLKEKLNGEFETPKKMIEEDDIEFLHHKNLQTSYRTCRSEMDFTRPKYCNNTSPAIENLIRIMGIPFLLTPEDSWTPMRRALSPGLFDSKNAYDNFAILNRKHLDASFTNPKITDVTFRKYSVDSRTLTKVTDFSSPQLAQKFLSRCQSRESVDTPPSDERVVDFSRCEIKESLQCIKIAEKDETFQETIYVSEVYFLLMASNRNRRMKMAMLSKSERPRTESRDSDSAFSDFMASDQE
jgi:hypothetical protein